jgi:hypothetical protein
MLARVAVDRGPGLPSLSALGASAAVAALAAYLRQVLSKDADTVTQVAPSSAGHPTSRPTQYLPPH